MYSHLLDKSVRQVSHVPILGGAADFEDKVAEELFPHWRVRDFGVELNAKHILVRVGDGSKRAGVSASDRAEAVGHPSDLIGGEETVKD